MGIPIDLKGVMDAVAAVEEDRKKPVGVHVYFDDAAPSDLASAMEEAFTTNLETASVYFSMYGGGDAAMPRANVDTAIIVAGPSSFTGGLYQQLHEAGFPAFIVTTCPRLVRKLAQMNGQQIEDADIIAPFKDDEIDESQEPVALDEAGIAKIHASIGMWVAEVYPEKRLAYAAAFPFFRKALALDAVNATSVQNAGIGFVALIPGADMPLMTMNQVKMLLQIAAAYGMEIGKARAKEIAGVVGGGFACRAAARTLVGLVPALGWFVKAGIGYTGTQAMGRALIEYFEDGGDVSAFASNTAAIAKDYASGKRKIDLPSKVEEAKESAQKALDLTVTYVIPTVKEIGGVLAKNGLDADRVAKFAGGAVETAISTALHAVK